VLVEVAVDSVQLASSFIGRYVIRALGALMESPLRYRFFAPENILDGAEILPGQCVLEIGCGTGFFTIPAARLLGGDGRLIAIDVLPTAVENVSARLRAAGLSNVGVMRADARATGLEAESVDTVLLFGVVPAPMLPLDELLSEIHRVLRPRGTLAVWPSPPLWLPDAVVRSGFFAYTGKHNGVSNFTRWEWSARRRA
jgi:SAM-dependent methyltransferase